MRCRQSRPAVVPARDEHVNLVAAVRAVLVSQVWPVAGWTARPSGGAVTQREDLRQVAVEADERVIARNAGLQLA